MTVTERLQNLTYLACLAVASRCVRRVLPLIGPINIEQLQALEVALTLCESFSRYPMTAEVLNSNLDKSRVDGAIERIRTLFVDRNTAAVRAVTLVTESLQAGIEGLNPDIPSFSASTNLHRAHRTARDAIDCALDAIPEGKTDLEKVVREDIRNAILSNTPLAPAGIVRIETIQLLGNAVDPSQDGPLGPLWPDGAPQWAQPITATDLSKSKGLSVLEQRVFDLMIAGRTPREMAITLNIAWPLARLIERRVLRKLNLKSRSEFLHSQQEMMSVFVDAGRADSATIRDLFLALSEVYEKQGGSGLKVVRHLLRTSVIEGVPS